MQKFLRTQFGYTYDYSVNNLQDIKNCLYANQSRGTVYSGAQARMVRLTKHNSAHRELYDWLAEEVFSYLHNGTVETLESFDKWHKKVCDSFVANCSSIGITVQYGMAQKFLNLLMKYIYCFEDADTLHRSKFEFCHVALDGYTYNSTSQDYISATTYGSYTIHTPFYSTHVAPPPTIHKTPWSKLSYTQYIEIQKNIREYLRRNPLTYADVSSSDTLHLATVSPVYCLTPFETEFFIW